MRRNFSPSQCKYVVSVGVEVECGIRTEEDYRKLWEWVRENEVVADRFEGGSDGSVYVEGCDWRSLELRFWTEVERWELMEEVLRFLWEEVRIRQNSTCGNHVHIRLSDDYLPLLVYPQFIKYFQRAYILFSHHQSNPAKYLQRTRNQYCRFLTGDLEAAVIASYRGEGTRYRSVNFHALHEWHRTVEFRIMPYAESANEHIAQIQFILRTVESYIATVLRGKRVLECSEVSLPTFLNTQLRRLWCSFNLSQPEVVVVEVGNELPPLQVEVNNLMLGGELS
jgi:hypothetical protein